MFRTTECVGGIRSEAFPQYLVYSELRKIHPNFALWLVTTHLLNTVNNYAAAKFATRVREIVKNENEPQKNITNEPVCLKIIRLGTQRNVVIQRKLGFAALWHITSGPGLARNVF